MKSYLHGLTAKDGGSAIRPVVGSLYAQAGGGEAQAGSLIEEGLARRPETETAPQRGGGSLASLTGALDADSATLMQTFEAVPRRASAREAAGDREPQPQPQPQPQRKGAAYVPLAGEGGEGREARGSEAEKAGAPEDPDAPEAPEARRISQSVPPPFVEMRKEMQKEWQKDRTLLPPIPVSAWAAQSVATRPAAPAPPQQPDQIEIHIGRIEVTAVTPPTAAPPGPQPRKKSIDLGDYLKGRDGRAS